MLAKRHAARALAKDVCWIEAKGKCLEKDKLEP